MIFSILQVNLASSGMFLKADRSLPLQVSSEESTNTSFKKFDNLRAYLRHSI